MANVKSTSKSTAKSTTSKSTSSFEYKPLAGVPSISEDVFQKNAEEHAGQQRAIKNSLQLEQTRLLQHTSNLAKSKTAMEGDKASNGWERQKVAQLTLAEGLKQENQSLYHQQKMSGIQLDGYSITQERGLAGVQHQRDLFAVDKEKYAAKLAQTKSELNQMTAKLNQIESKVFDVEYN